MNDLILFQFESKQVRTLRDDKGDPWFVLEDVCTALEIKNPRNVTARLDEDQKGVHAMDTLGGSQQVTIINESGLYEAIIRSDKPEARKFRKWVTSEVLPSIRKHGGYISPAATPLQIEALVAEHIRLFDLLGGMDERDVIAYKDMLRGARGESMAIEVRKEWPISDRILVITGNKPTKADVITIGKRMASAHRAEYGRNPTKREQYVDGATRLVFHYSADDLPMLDRVITEYFA